jgi:hypothetical protein
VGARPQTDHHPFMYVYSPIQQGGCQVTRVSQPRIYLAVHLSTLVAADPDSVALHTASHASAASPSHT